MTAGTVTSRPKGPGVVLGVVSLVALVVVAIIAVTATLPPPPTIAEFAPQAVDQITDAPSEQRSRSGSGPGVDCAPGDTACVAAGGRVQDAGLKPPPIEVSRVRHCVGNPPRQTEDPQSPPCVPYFQGDNGGATWKGVTRDEVRIAVPANWHTSIAPRMEKYFNGRYEFYGRKLNLEPMESTKPDDEKSITPATMLADAVKADQEVAAFASTQYSDVKGRESIYYDELTRRKILSVNARPGIAGESHYRSRHPYQWSYLPGHDIMSRNMADMACRMLKGKQADFAGGVEQQQPRKFAIVYSTREGAGPDLGPMTAVLRSCQIEYGEPVEISDNGDRETIAAAPVVVSELQEAGVTSIFCRCHARPWMLLMDHSTKAGYFPEWLVDNYMYLTEEIAARNFDPAQVAHSFGIQWWPKQVRPEDSPWYWALAEVDPNYKVNPNDYYTARWLYDTLRMLAAGVQMAGPRLTPDSFAAGLQKAAFPNPGAGGPPYYQPAVSFRNDHTAVEDAALVWFSRTERSSWDGNAGAICYANSGTRYRVGSWPADYGDLFQSPCY